jgi:hypothetical protein
MLKLEQCGGIGQVSLFVGQLCIFLHVSLLFLAAGFLSGMVGSKGDLKQGLLGALTAGFNAKVLHPRLVSAGMMGSSGSLARQSPLRLCPKAVYAMRSTMLPWAA